MLDILEILILAAAGASVGFVTVCLGIRMKFLSTTIIASTVTFIVMTLCYISAFESVDKVLLAIQFAFYTPAFVFMHRFAIKNV